MLPQNLIMNLECDVGLTPCLLWPRVKNSARTRDFMQLSRCKLKVSGDNELPTNLETEARLEMGHALYEKVTNHQEPRVYAYSALLCLSVCERKSFQIDMQQQNV